MMPAALRRLRQDRRGAIAPMVAILGASLIGAAGVALDAGLYYVDSRDLQAATEAAALSAAVDPANATTRAQAFLSRNGYAGPVLQKVEVGRYCADAGTGWAARFHPAGATGNCTGNGANNAVRLTTSGESRRYLTAVLGSASPIPALGGIATAARIDEAGLAVTSGVLGIDPSLVNLLLSTLLGVNISLSQAQMTDLLSANVDAGYMFDALAARVGETGTYNDLLSRTVSLADLMAACRTALEKTGGNAGASAIQALAAQTGGTMQVPLAGLFDLGVWKNMPVGGAASQPSLRAGLNSYQLIAYAAQTASPPLLNVQVAPLLTLTGVAVNTAARPRFAFGPAGEVTAYTAAIRLKLRLNLGTGSVAGLSLVQAQTFDLVVELGQGSARIDSISCQQEAASDTVVQTSSGAGLLNVYLGAIAADPVQEPFTPIKPQFANGLSLNLGSLQVVGIGLRASLGPATGTAPSLQSRQFRQTAGGDGIIGNPRTGYAGTAARVGGTSQLAATLDGLSNGSGLDVKLTLLNNLLGIDVGALLSPVTGLLANLIKALGLDTLLTQLLQGLGLQAGYADTWVTGVRCGVPVLV